mmetsp:Transcript_11455/g.20917  ORF Transcript_11455/g.20917 Transcript_11455/m.20917 type:complete len:87 (+) Transcript_11455:1953-2213(+)
MGTIGECTRWFKALLRWNANVVQITFTNPNMNPAVVLLIKQNNTTRFMAYQTLSHLPFLFWYNVAAKIVLPNACLRNNRMVETLLP